jgi:prepilin-type N-terminal cleavage/methylation domain-containing protein
MKGFTLIEFLIVFGIFAVLTALAIFSPLVFKKGVDLDGESQKIVSVLNIGQSNAKSRRDQNSWGVHLESRRAVLFRGATYNPGDGANQVFYLADGLEISAINLNGGGADVVFAQLSGETQNFGSFRVNFVSDPSRHKEIRIDFSGQAAVLGASLPPADTRVYDSRHVHYHLGWTIKNSTKIIFNFPGIPQIQEVLMAEYFNADKTDFDWSGSFTVGGQVQEFRIHTHFLTPLDTLLSVSRDRSDGKNNEEVVIYIDYEGGNREIGRYAADGSVTVGDYGGEMAIQ